MGNCNPLTAAHSPMRSQSRHHLTENLHSSAYLKQLELMVAKRTLSADGSAMDVRQTVILPDGTMPTNTTTYRRLN
ncbi:MAG: hypothetical protein AAFV45_00165 [Pseudomonadota bacterium]